jgi:uncharacterized protein (DUF1330 family)
MVDPKWECEAMPGYLVVSLDIKDADMFARYTAEMPALLQRWGGEFVVRGGKLQPLEGDAPKPRLVIIKFPSVDDAREFYYSVEYEPLKRIRQAATESNVLLVEGYRAI